jgi:CRISPR-associated DxTHG motif protein
MQSSAARFTNIVTHGVRMVPLATTVLRGFSFGGLVLTLLPTSARCANDKDHRRDIPDFNKNSKSLPEDKKEKEGVFFDFDKLIASSFDEKNGAFGSVKNLFESGVPGQVGYGFLMGYSSGFCIKKASKFGAFVLGSSFILIQSLSYGGLIKVDYDGIQKKVEVRLICLSIFPSVSLSM